MGHLGEDENDFNSFFSPKMRKMEHRSWSTWSTWSTWSHGNDAMGRSAELRIQRLRGSASFSRARVGPPRLIQRLYLGEVSLWVILGRTKMISIPFFHQKCAKWNTDPGAGGAHGATETTPWAAPWSFGSSARGQESSARGQEHALGARIT